MPFYQSQVEEAAAYVDRHAGSADIGIMTGTGLGESIESMTVKATVAYETIPHFPVSTVQSHYGRMLAGEIYGKSVLAMQGRFHLYEGYTAKAVAFPIRVMQVMGVHTLILSNAAGGINPGFAAGDIMMIADHINLTGDNPLTGSNVDKWGPRFPDMTAVYAPALMQIAGKAADAAGFSLQSGVYVGLKGPSLETPSETRYLRQIGGDAVGLSTVMEAIAGAHAGMQILGLSTITNINNPDRPEPASVASIITVAEQAAPRHARIIEAVAKELGPS